MFNSPVIDLAILLSFTYFIGSLILAAVNEAIAGALRLRQHNLRDAIAGFLPSSSWSQFVKYHFFPSPHIQALMKRENMVPAYIPAKSFVAAITQHLGPEAYKEGKIVSLQKANGEDIIPPDLKIVLDTIMKQSSALQPADQLHEFERRLEEFYNSAMDRVTGWYKKKSRRYLLILAIILSVILNIDTIKITNDAMADVTRLEKTADNISSNLARYGSLDSFKLVVNETAGQIDVSRSLKNADSVLIEYKRATGYSLGYASAEEFWKQWSDHLFIKLIGILLTAFALQLGSNFWFDLLNKAVNIRAVGPRPNGPQNRPIPIQRP